MKEWYQDEVYQPFSLVHDDAPGYRPGALLIHGFTGSPADMRPLGELVHGHGIDAHGMRVPGMASDIEHINEMTAKIWRDDVLRRWDRHCARYSSNILIGYSMGGSLALHAAAQYPPDLLILVAPLVRLGDRRAEVLPVARHLVRRIRPFAGLTWDDPLVHDWFRRAMPAIDTADLATQAFLRDEAAVSTAMLNELRILARGALRHARRITAPTIIVQGYHDVIVRPRDTRSLSSRMGGMVSYREVPGDHFLPVKAFGEWPRLERVLRHELRMWMDSRR
jgi:carboxylesterase